MYLYGINYNEKKNNFSPELTIDSQQLLKNNNNGSQGVYIYVDFLMAPESIGRCTANQLIN